MYQKYKALTESENNVIFGGRLGEYKYYDMDKVVGVAFRKAREVLG
nr:UDP-galactopyranose mutase [Bacillus haynesii]